MDLSSGGTLSIIQGERANPSSKDTLSKLFAEIIEWRAIFQDDVVFQWTELHLSVVRDYVLKLDLNSRCRTLRAARLFEEPLWYSKRHNIKNNRLKVACFTLQLQEFFKVPKPWRMLDSPDAVEENELLAAFINFLLRLLSHTTDLIGPLEDRVDSLQKDLRFLFTVLGDASLLCSDQEQVLLELMAEFKTVANEAGSLAHSFIFSTDLSFRTMNENLDTLFTKIGLLNNNIIQFSAMLPALAQASPRMAHVDSLFNVDSFLYDLHDLLNQDSGLDIIVKSQIQTLRQKLMPLVSFLKIMALTPNSKIDGREQVEAWIRGTAYEAEYLIISFLVRDAPIQYFSNKLANVIYKIELIQSKFQRIKKDYEDPTLHVGKQPAVQANLNSEVDGVIVGFEENAMNILEQLVGAQNLEVISISGMPGLGKTTVAKMLYNHPTVKHRFDTRSWCVVSQTYDRRNILIDILISTRGGYDKSRILGMEEESLGDLVYKSLWGRRYLIVMDDIWDPQVWYDLRRFFPKIENGSRILLTSRNKALLPPDSKIHELPYLTDEQCWELLKRRVFPTETSPRSSELVRVGKEIAANCGGLPLMVVVVAGILSTLEKKESVWKKVGDDLSSNVCAKGKNVMQILGLSYSHLPEHLKPCFLYFGAFPEDTEIPARKLMRLWVAEGFVREEPGKTPESIAEEYLHELIDKSLIIVAKRRTNGGVKACLIHDLLREFCLMKCQGEEFMKFVNDNNCSVHEKGHRLLSRQRSVTPFGQHVRSFQGYLLDSPFYVRNMRLLRVLAFKRMNNEASLVGIENLIHLRYLVTNELTALIGNLLNLEYLYVENNNAVRIPSVILKMVKLRHLQVKSEATFDDECSSSQMSNLKVLSNIILKKKKDEEILKCSPHLRKLKCTCKPLSEGKLEERCLDLQEFTQLESLNVKFTRHRKGEIKFPPNVVKLTLSGMFLPWEKMSIIGELPHLKVLKLGSDAFVGGTWDSVDGEFEQLRFLKLEKLDLAGWIVESSNFPRLERLVVYLCWNLEEIPIEIGDIPTLQVIEVQSCSQSVDESAVKIQKEQWDMGNYDLTVITSQFIHQESFDSEMKSLESLAAMLAMVDDDDDDDNTGSSMDHLSLPMKRDPPDELDI